MPMNGTWPCATCGTLVYPYEVRGDGCVDCPKVEAAWGRKTDCPVCGVTYGRDSCLTCRLPPVVVPDLVDLICEACDQPFEGRPMSEDDLHGPFCFDCTRHR